MVGWAASNVELEDAESNYSSDSLSTLNFSIFPHRSIKVIANGIDTQKRMRQQKN